MDGHALAHLTVTAPRLHFARASLKHLKDGRLGKILLQLLLNSKDPKDGENSYACDTTRADRQFFSYTQSPHEISLILGETDVALFPPNMLQLDADLWKAVQICEGELGFQKTGIVQALCSPLAKAKLSVMYFSTFLTDFLFIKEKDLDMALHVLKTSFAVTIDMVKGDEQVPYMGSGDASIWQAQLDLVEQEAFVQAKRESEGIGDEARIDVHRHLLSTLPLKLCVSRLDKGRWGVAMNRLYY
jgi:hypothetical protein